MSISDLSSSQLNELIALVKRREELETELAKVNAALGEFDGKKSSVITRGAGRPGRPRKKRESGRKDAILEVLRKAPAKGLSIPEIAKALNTKPANVSQWIYTTGKKTKAVKKVSRGLFASAS